MPLETQFPVLDDRRYDDIVEEIRTRIPRYTPEWRPQWSDLNDSDPGMILVQTFAWLSDMLLYRLDQVPELQYLKFLELIGIELQPALPARAEISFAVAASASATTVSVPAGTQVSADADDGPPIVFETERDLTALAAELRSVQSWDAAVYEDVTGWNADPATHPDGFYPFGEAPRENAALVLGFALLDPAATSFPAVTINLACFSAESTGTTPIQDCGPGATRAYAPAKVQWEGFDGTDWQPMDTLNDETLTFTRSGHLFVRTSSGLGLQQDYMGEYDGVDPVTQQPRPKLFWIRARLTRTQYERPPRLSAVRINTVPAIQAQTVLEEILGGTTGARNQTWQLENAPVLRDSLTIEINEGPGDAAQAWTIVDDLFGAGRDDRQLAVDWTSGEVRAGDGERGQVPIANASDPDTNVRAVRYQFGGGIRGNVRAGAIANLLASINGIDGGQTTNVFAASGGTDEERIDDAKVRARQMLRARDRAVAVEDFELLAKQAGNVRRAKALPLANPSFPGVKVPGAVTLIVVPDSKVPAPQPSDGLLQTVCAYLDARRLLTTELFVVGPHYVSVSVEARVVSTDDADRGKVKESVETVLSSYLHPLTGGEDGLGWPFGGTIRYSQVLQRVFTVDGVSSVPSLFLVVDGERRTECRDVPIDPNALVYPVAHAITVDSLSETEEPQ